MPRGLGKKTLAKQTIAAAVKRRQTRRYKRSMKSASTSIATSYKLFPVRKTVILKYNDQLAYNGSAASLQVYAMNNLYDLDYTNGGTNSQPRGYDTLSSLYNRYICYSGTAYITAHSLDTTNGSFMVAYPTLQPGPTLTAYPNIKPLSEQTGARQVYLPKSGDSKTIKVHFSCKNQFGIPLKEIKDNATVYGSTTSGAPSRVGYINIVGYPGDFNIGTTNTNIVFTVKLRLKCIFLQQAQDLSQ